jgi:hypothetical protein
VAPVTLFDASLFKLRAAGNGGSFFWLSRFGAAECFLQNGVFSKTPGFTIPVIGSVPVGVAAWQLCPKLCIQGAGHVVLPCAMVAVSPGVGAKAKQSRSVKA